ncbi:hypothetical protein CPT03_21890 [Pedobacter ginsengisoli]|uniref:Uncharacterized protein n=1 Tax=Pedobacter ginsengisoli TaxID=363852 RepID=A0A2D1UBH2_9SPHI|nr:hypothetical protein [Pedobacter ginsengisoli]ATP58929.1 hypothetical protein CPT03_21890 [Pedobacter ginsengisoli]
MNAISGAIIGAILGFLSGVGYLNMNVKKSQWLTMFPIVTSITTIVGACTGGKIGYNIERSEKINRALGLDKVHYIHFKVGRFWQSESTWQDCKGRTYKLKTLKGNQASVSYLDGFLLCNHGTSASSVNISKYHAEAKEGVFKALREKHGDEYLQILNQKPK